ncbi:MAG: hypothetical protein ACK53Y_21165, partial [bacterium]
IEIYLYIGAHTIYNGQYTHQRNAKDYPLEREERIRMTRRQSRDHTSKIRRKLTFRQRQLMKHA